MSKETKEELLVVPRKVKKADIKRLKEEGRYQDIYVKYGEKELKKARIDAEYDERKMTQGVVKARLWKLKAKFFKNALAIGTGTVLGLSAAVPIIVPKEMQKTVKANEAIHEEEIKNYNEKINKYADEVKSEKLDDMGVFMKVMKDMWENIEGYGDPQKDIQGFWELDLANEDGVGVCRNMASDVAKKLNAINPKYNARIMSVNVDEAGNYTMANIKRNFVQSDNEMQNENTEKNWIGEMAGEALEYVAGNHAVTLVDIPEDNLMLILDPTNPGIGLYQKGKITMLNSDKLNGKKFDPRHGTSSVMRTGGMQNIEEVIKDLVKSYEEPKITEEQIEEKYGLKKQNDTLDKINQETSQRSQFVKSLQVSVDGNTILQSAVDEENGIQQKQNGDEEITH